MTFYVGQKIVCVNDEFSRHWLSLVPKGLTAFPKRGEVYTVRASLVWEFNNGPSSAIRLVEIANPVVNWDNGTRTEISYPVWRFRPLTERSTDTGFAILKKLLNPTHERIGA